MGVLTKALNWVLIAIPLALVAESAGIHIFSESLFSVFGVVFFFLVFLNELSMIYL